MRRLRPRRMIVIVLVNDDGDIIVVWHFQALETSVSGASLLQRSYFNETLLRVTLSRFAFVVIHPLETASKITRCYNRCPAT